MIGYSLFSFKGVNWFRSQRCLFPLTPPGALNSVNSECSNDIRVKSNSVLVRWESDFDNTACGHWWHIIKDGAASLSDMSKNTRNQVRRGLKGFDCGLLSRNDIITEGYVVYCRAFSRYETHERKLSASEFFNAVTGMPEQTEFWGARNKTTGALVAFSENYVEDLVCFYTTAWFDPSSLREYSSYALFYEMNRHYLEDREFSYVSDGARNLSHNTQIHEFLESKFGFRKAFARLNVVYTPWLGAAIAVAFPFRNLINKVPWALFKQASILLKQEEIRRACAEDMNE